MKTLYLTRHAKSSWEFDLTDHQRPLNERGQRDAPRVASAVADKMPKPDLIMSSDAVRAKTTAFIFANTYEVPENEVVLEPKLYDFSGQNVVQVIRTCPDNVDRLMIFGHNNAMTNFVNVYGNKPIDNVPTAGFIAIEFDINHWKNLNQGRTVFTCFPKEL